MDETVRIEGKIVSGHDREIVFDRLMTALLDGGVIDPAVSGSLASGEIEIEFELG